MSINLKDVPNLVLAIRWGFLAAAIVCLFVLDWVALGFTLVVVGLVFSTAMRFEAFRIWFVGKVTGLGVQVVRGARAQPAPTPQPEQSAEDAPPPQPEQSPEELNAIVAGEREEAVLLKRHWPPSVPAPQNSWLGGTPNLPDGVDWPHNPETGFALHHLGQIDLGEMPRPAGGADLPAAGMLWFFADIDEELCWDSGPETGPTGGYSKVVYHPDSTSGIAPCAVPDNLPEVDHSMGEMTGTLWGHRAPKFSVYPRWPVTGHVSGAWAFSDRLPDDVVDRTGYYNAQIAANDAERASVLGAPAPRGSKLSIFEERQETAKSWSGEKTVRRVHIYQPDAHGGRFPYCGAFGHAMTAWIWHNLETQFSDLERRAATSRGLQDDDVVRLENIAAARPQVRALLERIRTLAPLDPLPDATRRDFDVVMTLMAANKLGYTPPNDMVRKALISVVAQSIETPEVFAVLPTDVVASVERTVLPSHGYTNHYLLGPKGAAGNPTNGAGVRLAQFDSDTAMGMMFCDVGIIDFWIDPDDLAACHWDRAWAATAGG